MFIVYWYSKDDVSCNAFIEDRNNNGDKELSNSLTQVENPESEEELLEKVREYHR